MRVQPAGSGGSAVASNDSASSSPGRRDDEEIVGFAQQLAHVALARVASRHQLPWRLCRHAACSRSCTALCRPARPLRKTRASADPRHCVETLYARRRRARVRDANLIPVDAHARDDAHLDATLTGTFPPDRRPPSAAGRRGYRSPSRPSAMHQPRPHLQRRRLERQPGLVRGDVVARKRVVGPAGEQKQRRSAPSRRPTIVNVWRFA